MEKHKVTKDQAKTIELFRKYKKEQGIKTNINDNIELEIIENSEFEDEETIVATKDAIKRQVKSENNNDLTSGNIFSMFEKIENENNPETTPDKEESFYKISEETQQKDNAEEAGDENKDELDEELYKKIKQKKTENLVYFSVPERFLKSDMSKSEIYIYLTHCRAAGKKQSKKAENGKLIRRSIAAATNVKANFEEFNPKFYEKTMKSLEYGGFIIREPLTDKEKARTIFKSKEYITITKTKNENYIQLPIELMDKGIFKGLKIKQIKNIITLYKYFNPEDWGCIGVDDFSLKNLENDYESKPIGYYDKGHSRALQGKAAYRIKTPFEKPEEFIETSNEELKGLNYKELIESGIFSLVPLIYSIDEEDIELKKIIGEIYKGYSRFPELESDYDYIWHLPQVKGRYPIIIWALKPYYPVKTPQYKEFKNIEKNYESTQLVNYKQKNLKIDMIYDSEFLDNAFNFIYDEDTSDSLHGKIEKLNKLPHKQELNRKIKILKIQLNNEKENIKQYNKTMKLVHGKRTRITTSSRLKQIQEDIRTTGEILVEIRKIEDEIINLVPIQHFITNSTNPNIM